MGDCRNCARTTIQSFWSFCPYCGVEDPLALGPVGSRTPDLRAMLEAFHDAFEEEVFSRSQRNQTFRKDLLEEEFREYEETVEAEGFDGEAMVEELADMVYLCFGTAVCHDLDLYAELEAIHEENMAKDSLKTPEDYE